MLAQRCGHGTRRAPQPVAQEHRQCEGEQGDADRAQRPVGPPEREAGEQQENVHRIDERERAVDQEDVPLALVRGRGRDLEPQHVPLHQPPQVAERAGAQIGDLEVIAQRVVPVQGDQRVGVRQHRRGAADHH